MKKKFEDLVVTDGQGYYDQPAHLENVKEVVKVRINAPRGSYGTCVRGIFASENSKEKAAAKQATFCPKGKKFKKETIKRDFNGLGL